MKLGSKIPIIVATLGSLLSACSESIQKFHTLEVEQGNTQNTNSLSVSWFGASFVMIDDGKSSVLIDPFVSREENTPLDILIGANAEVSKEKVQQKASLPEFQRSRVILVGHSHYDHSIDVAEFARELNIPVFGSKSTSRIVEAHGYENFNEIDTGTVISSEIIGGGFDIHVLPGAHGAPPFFWDPLEEEVADDFSLPAPISEYGLGEVHSFLIVHRRGTILHMGSAGIAPGSFDHLANQVDVILLPLIGRPDTDQYLADIVGKLRPKVVIPIHYDNLFQPSNEEIRVVRQADLGGFFSAMQRLFPEVETGILVFDQPWKLEGNN